MIINFCVRCGKSTIKEINQTEYTCTSCNHTIWNNPKTTVIVAFYREGQLLYSKRAIEPDKGKYDLPGGFLNYNENVRGAAVREVYEETSVRIDPTKLEFVDFYAHEYIPGEISTIDIIFIIREWEGEFIPSDDSESLEWKPIKFLDSPEFCAGYAKLKDMIVNAL